MVMLVYLLIAVLVLLLAVSLPVWPYSRAWGFFGAGGIGGILLLVLLLVRLHVF